MIYGRRLREIFQGVDVFVIDVFRRRRAEIEAVLTWREEMPEAG
jgi:hypothetical protein